MEDSRIGNKELLVARGNKRYREICGRVRFVSENEEQNRRSSGEVEVE